MAETRTMRGIEPICIGCKGLQDTENFSGRKKDLIRLSMRGACLTTTHVIMRYYYITIFLYVNQYVKNCKMLK